MNKTFSPSINIVRDSGLKKPYTVTENARRAFMEIFGKNIKGLSSFCIIGTYGTGKSAFINAALNDLKDDTQKFGIDVAATFAEPLLLVGNYASLHEELAQLLQIEDHSKKSILKALKDRIKTLKKDDLSTVLIIDEFGKYLEYAAKHEAQKELFLVQEIAELANSENSHFTLITTLHQNFSAYNLDFDGRDAAEWIKVQGRFKEIPFNEPVQQLVKIAAQRISSIENIYRNGKADYTSFQIELVQSSNILPEQFHVNEETTKQLYPFDYIAAAILCSALQKYGQNERSLFSFLEAEGDYSLKTFNPENAPYYNTADVADYLLHHLHPFLNTNRNPDFIQWNALKSAVERLYSAPISNITAAMKLIKTIGLLDLFGSVGKKVNQEFLTVYGKECLGIDDVEKTIEELEEASIIRFIHHKRSYRLYEGSDLNIQLALKDELRRVDLAEDISRNIQQYFTPRPILAKRVSYKTGIPRVLEPKIIESFDIKSIKRRAEFDGAIYLLFNETDKIDTWFKDISDASIFAIYNNPRSLRKRLKQITAIQNIIDNHLDDRVAVRELKELKHHEIETLNKSINEGLFKGDYTWYFDKHETEIHSYNEFQKILSNHIEKIYHLAPIYKNELINRHKISASIGTARKKLLKQIEENKHVDNLAFDETKNPPEKTIYLSLLKKTGIHRQEKGFGFFPPEEKSFKALWDYTNQFFERSKQGRRTLLELWEGYKQKPFGLKDGFIQYWIPIVLLIKEHDIAVYYEDRLMLNLNAEMLNLLTKNPHKFEVKAFSVSGVRLDILNTYRELAQIENTEELSTSSYVDTLKPILVFYKELPEYPKQTKKGISTEARQFLDAIKRTKDLEDAFFTDFPRALGYRPLDETTTQEDLKQFVNELQSLIVDVREALQRLTHRIELKIQKSLGIEDASVSTIRLALKKRYSSISENDLLKTHNLFLKRVELEFDSPLEWLNAVSQALIGKTLDNYTDEDEQLFVRRFSNMIFELDNLAKLDTTNFDKTKEIAYRVAIHSTDKGSFERQVNVPRELVDNASKSVILGALEALDKRSSIAILSSLLEDLIQSNE